MLKYNGKGYIPGIPARDLTDDEVEKYGGEDELLKLGIYEKPKAQTGKKGKRNYTLKAETGYLGTKLPDDK